MGDNIPEITMEMKLSANPSLVLREEEEGWDAESSETVGMAVGVADVPQAESISAKMLVNIQNTFFIIIHLHVLLLCDLFNA